jgi:hypothetical protein
LVNWKINKTTWAQVDSLTDRTALGLRYPPQTVAAVDLPCPRFPTTVSPPPDLPPRRLRPPPLLAIKGAHPLPPREQPFFLPLVTPTTPPCFTVVEPPCSAAPGPPSKLPVAATSITQSCSTFPHYEPLTITPDAAPPPLPFSRAPTAVEQPPQ